MTNAVPRSSAPLARTLLSAAAFVVLVAGMRAASSVVIPLLLALFASILAAPVLAALEKRLPFVVALTLVAAGLTAIAVATPLLLGGSLLQFMDNLPVYQAQLGVLEEQIFRQLERWEVQISPQEFRELFDPAWFTRLLTRFLESLVRVTGDTVVVIVAACFMLTEAAWFPLKMRVIFHDRPEGPARIREIVINVRRYIVVKTGVSLATGLLLGLANWAAGVDYPGLWGFIAFLLNYIPTVGSIIAGVPPILLAIVGGDYVAAALLTAAYAAVNQLFGSVIEPQLMGRRLGLSPLVVFASLLFWGWALGPVGMLLSAPLTMSVRIALDSFDETRAIAVMLGGKPKLTATVAH